MFQMACIYPIDGRCSIITSSYTLLTGSSNAKVVSRDESCLGRLLPTLYTQIVGYLGFDAEKRSDVEQWT